MTSFFVNMYAMTNRHKSVGAIKAQVSVAVAPVCRCLIPPPGADVAAGAPALAARRWTSCLSAQTRTSRGR